MTPMHKASEVIPERLELTPIKLRGAIDVVRKWHRHSKPPLGGLFAIGVKSPARGMVVGVAIVSRPVSRHLDDGLTAEVTRLCTDGSRNACSMLYGAASRAAKALGYRRLLTYTMTTEDGASLRAANWILDQYVTRGGAMVMSVETKGANLGGGPESVVGAMERRGGGR